MVLSAIAVLVFTLTAFPHCVTADKAHDLLDVMTQGEKLGMLRGYEGLTEYVGYVPGIDRLGIPPITMNDGPQGFRVQNGMDGTTTQWPSALAVASTFDVDAASAWAHGMGKEFAGKGSNVQLGPGLNVARVPINGRNFEYLSGEDPILGATLVGPVIKGIQDEGVVANAKHYVNNNQEYARTEVVEVVDERTQWEVYMLPFQAAIEAGVGSVMCSYNNVSTSSQQADGVSFWACENPETLTTDLKKRMSFDGWVMSDWGATHSTVQAVVAGLDQEMPGNGFFSEEKLSIALDNGAITQAQIDDKVLRILRPMLDVGLFEGFAPWREGSLENDVTSGEHTQLARDLAAASQILIKNDGLLPLPLANNLFGEKEAKQQKQARSGDGLKVAVIGDSASFMGTFGGGGSGAVVPKHAVSVLEGIYNELGVNYTRIAECTTHDDTDYYQPTGNLAVGAVSVQDCCSQCTATVGCTNFAFTEDDAGAGLCYLKPNDEGERTSDGVVAGDCPGPSSTNGVTFTPTADPAAAAEAARSADVAIVVVATTSSEGSDRANLSYDDASLALVNSVTAVAGNKTLVVAVTPGAVLLPFMDDAAAVIVSIMPGQEHGNGLRDVLWGRTNPAARLPITLPNIDNEVALTEAQYPGIGNGPVATYSEELLVGYKWYAAKGVEPKACFGHGLSYTTFAYSNLTIRTDTSSAVVSVTATVTNTGDVSGDEVAQLYLGYPPESQEPLLQLRSFTKAKLMPGESTTVMFALGTQAVSIWDTGAHAFVQQAGAFSVSVGASSCDIKLTGTFVI